MKWQISITDRAKKMMRRVPKSDFRHIEEAINEMAIDPFLGDLQKLGGGTQTWRRRIGSYRIIFETSVQQKIIFITDIRRRASNTY